MKTPIQIPQELIKTGSMNIISENKFLSYFGNNIAIIENQQTFNSLTI